MLHLGDGGLLDAAVVDRCVSLVETTSPSALLSGSLDAARRLAFVHGEELLSETLAAIAVTRRAIEALPGLGVLDEGLVGRFGIAGWDPLRLAIDVRGTGSTGYRVAKTAFELDDPIDFELAAENLVVAIFGLGEPAAAAGERLVGALEATLERLGSEGGRPQEPLAPPPPWGELAMTPRDAFLGPQEVVAFDDAVGRVAAEALAAYPPGIPNVLPGERLTRETLDYIRERRPRRARARGRAATGSSGGALKERSLWVSFRRMPTFDRLADLPLTPIEGNRTRTRSSRTGLRGFKGGGNVREGRISNLRRPSYRAIKGSPHPEPENRKGLGDATSRSTTPSTSRCRTRARCST